MVHTRHLFNEMINIIKKKESNNDKIYKFQEIKIQNISCLCEIYLIQKIFIIKSKYINVLFDPVNNYYGKYILYHHNYNDLDDLLFHISDIHNNFVLYNGVLMDNIQKKNKITELKFFNIVLNTCSICYQYTNETTLCNHFICLYCREKMLIRQYSSCPICRKQNVIQFFSNDINKIYNSIYDELNFINNIEILNAQNIILNTHHHFGTGTPRGIITPNDIPYIMNLILVREIIGNTSFYPFLLSINIYNFIHSKRFMFYFSVFSILYFYYIIFCTGDEDDIDHTNYNSFPNNNISFCYYNIHSLSQSQSPYFMYENTIDIENTN